MAGIINIKQILRTEYLSGQRNSLPPIKKRVRHIIYFPDGKVQQTFTYNNGKKEGLSKEYDEDGNINHSSGIQ